MSDKPSFLIGVDETPEEKEIMDVLRDEPPAPPAEEGNENTPPSQQSDESSGADSSNSDGTDSSATDAASTDGNKPASASAGDGESAPQPSQDAPKPSEETPAQAAQRQVSLKFGTFKTPEEAEKAFKEMQRTLTRLTTEQKKQAEQPAQQGKQPDAFSQQMQLASTTPLVDVKLPKGENYRLDDGSFDIDSYGRDLTRNIILSFQQSLVGGKLGAVTFGMLQQAMGEEFQSSKQAQEHTERAASIESKIMTQWPVFKQNEKVANMLQRAIYGEGARRKMEAERSGKEYQPLTEDDFMNMAKEIVESLDLKVAPQQQDPADKPAMTPTMQPSGTFRSTGVDADIEGMMNARNKSGSIF